MGLQALGNLFLFLKPYSFVVLHSCCSMFISYQLPPPGYAWDGDHLTLGKIVLLSPPLLSQALSASFSSIVLGLLPGSSGLGIAVYTYERPLSSSGNNVSLYFLLLPLPDWVSSLQDFLFQCGVSVPILMSVSDFLPLPYMWFIVNGLPLSPDFSEGIICAFFHYSLSWMFII